jgi:hypothetical protein
MQRSMVRASRLVVLSGVVQVRASHGSVGLMSPGSLIVKPTERRRDSGGDAADEWAPRGRVL